MDMDKDEHEMLDMMEYQMTQDHKAQYARLDNGTTVVMIPPE